MNDTLTKWCTRCQDHRPITEFGFRRRGRPARRSWCNPCVAEEWRLRRAGVNPIAPTFDDRVAGDGLVCTCPVAEPARGQAGACECGFPIVALMAPSCRERMDVLWPEWRAQIVVPMWVPA